MSARDDDELGGGSSAVTPRERWSQRPSTRQTDPSVSEATERVYEDVRAEEATEHAPLFAADDAERLRARWEVVQASFVDEPRHAVEEADGLVKVVIGRLSESFSAQRERMEQAWTSGDDDEVSTEDLRLALQRYRSFFERLLSL